MTDTSGPVSSAEALKRRLLEVRRGAYTLDLAVAAFFGWPTLRPPPFTVDLARALQLRPKGWRYVVTDLGVHPHPGKAILMHPELTVMASAQWPAVWPAVLPLPSPGQASQRRAIHASAATPELAVCIAAIDASLPSDSG